MANQQQLEILQQGINAWNAWRNEHPEVQPDLSGAMIGGANLTGANLHDADLRNAILNGADLTEANLNGAITDSP